jgi:hypothetical protein
LRYIMYKLRYVTLVREYMLDSIISQ